MFDSLLNPVDNLRDPGSQGWILRRPTEGHATLVPRSKRAHHDSHLKPLVNAGAVAQLYLAHHRTSRVAMADVSDWSAIVTSPPVAETHLLSGHATVVEVRAHAKVAIEDFDFRFLEIQGARVVRATAPADGHAVR